MTDLADVTWPVRTARLTLRLMQTEDLDVLWRIHSSPEGRQWTGGVIDRPDFDARYSTPENLATTLVVLLDDAVIGDVMVKVTDGWGQRPVLDQTKRVEADLGWCFDASVHGRGYATETLEAVLDLCFSTLGIRRAFAEAFLANEPSWRLMERVGMRREAHAVADSLHSELGWLDGVRYAILADEWRAASTTRR